MHESKVDNCYLSALRILVVYFRLDRCSLSDTLLVWMFCGLLLVFKKWSKGDDINIFSFVFKIKCWIILLTFYWQWYFPSSWQKFHAPKPSSMERLEFSWNHREQSMLVILAQCASGSSHIHFCVNWFCTSFSNCF